VALLPESGRDNIPAGYSKLLNDRTRRPGPGHARLVRLEDAMLPYAPPAPCMRRTSSSPTLHPLVTHYWSKDHFIDPDEVLANAGKLADIPTCSCRGSSIWQSRRHAWLLAQALPHAELVMVSDEGTAAVAGMRHA